MDSTFSYIKSRNSDPILLALFACAFGYRRSEALLALGYYHNSLESGVRRAAVVLHLCEGRDRVLKMKIFVKTLKGSHFEIEVQPQDMVSLLSLSVLVSFLILIVCIKTVARNRGLSTMFWIPVCVCYFQLIIC